MNCKEHYLDSQLRLTENGYSLVELLICVAIIMTLAALAVPYYLEMVNSAKTVVAISDIKQISNEINFSSGATGNYPNSLDDLGFGSKRDPWGRPYQYMKINVDKKGKCKGARKDKNLHPLNSDYDLYSIGKDGKSSLPLTAKNSQDDIIRANDGGFIGLASNY